MKRNSGFFGILIVALLVPVSVIHGQEKKNKQVQRDLFTLFK